MECDIRYWPKYPQHWMPEPIRLNKATNVDKKVITMSQVLIEQTELATVKDALQIIHLLYEDMVKHNIKTKARDMAGRLLYSERFEKLEARINDRYTYVEKPDKT